MDRSTNCKLNTLYEDISSCHICPNMDKEKVLRLVSVVNLASDVFIISQTLAESQLRRSGVNFFQANGHLGNTGATLEKFFNKFNRTVYPYQRITLQAGVTIPKCHDGYLSVYNTEIAQCYPGKKLGSKGDRPPTNKEIKNCLAKGFLTREIELVKPKLVFLTGKTSRDIFFDQFLRIPFPESLSEHIKIIAENAVVPQLNVGNIIVNVVPIQHASGANPRFYEMVKNTKLIEVIKEVLR